MTHVHYTDPDDAPRTTATRHVLGIRWPRVQDRVCRRKGHRLSIRDSVGTHDGAYWPLCLRCGRGVESQLPGWPR